jgi:hypothetical protein
MIRRALRKNVEIIGIIGLIIIGIFLSNNGGKLIMMLSKIRMMFGALLIVGFLLDNNSGLLL